MQALEKGATRLFRRCITLHKCLGALEEYIKFMWVCLSASPPAYLVVLVQQERVPRVFVGQLQRLGEVLVVARGISQFIGMRFLWSRQPFLPLPKQ